jgi:hypothetical protein
VYAPLEVEHHPTQISSETQAVFPVIPLKISSSHLRIRLGVPQPPARPVVLACHGMEWVFHLDPRGGVVYRAAHEVGLGRALCVLRGRAAFICIQGNGDQFLYDP